MHFLVSKQGILWEGEEEGGEEEEQEEEEEGDQAKVWMLDFGMNFVWNSQVLCEGPCTCMARSLPQTYGC